MSSIADLRQEYNLKGLSERDVSPEPFLQFEHWFQDAIQAGIPEPNAMVLATVDASLRVSSRVVLLKGLDDSSSPLAHRGFIFFTNYESRKGKAIKDCSFVSVTFPWISLQRQVHIAGKISKVTRKETEVYFATRPRESQLGAWASRQSEVIESRQVLEQAFQEFSQKFEHQEIPAPESWGGYRLTPERIEFWQGRVSRLHDRICYTKVENNWKIERLSP